MPKKSTDQTSSAAKLEKLAVKVQSELIYDFVYAAQYKRAFELAKKLKAKFPDNRFAQYHYAVALGDCGEWATSKTAEKNSKIAALLLRDLLRRSSGIDSHWRRSWRNEYYWFSKQHFKQWKLGRELVRAGQPKARYSMGVGAVSLAFSLVSKGKTKQGLVWASKARKAWEEYFQFVPDYYNSYVWYAKSLGILGDAKGMERALSKAAKLAKRPLNYREFTEAKRAIKAAIASGAKK